MNSHLSVLVTPRDGLHYQNLLYRHIEASGVRVHYDKGPTPSQTVNIMLAPAVLLWFRLRGVRILHIHWLFQFSLPWARRRPWARRLMEWWFGLYLQTAQRLGYAIVWTAHDLQPHEQIFTDDTRARNLLISKARVVIALSEATATQVRELSARQVRVAPMGSYADPYPVTLTRAEARASFGFTDDDTVLSLIGRIEHYKGADLLLAAASQLPSSSRVKVLVAGICTDHSYSEELFRLSRALGGRATIFLEWVPDEDLARHFQATDIAVFPFREITNSASVMLAQSFGVPVVIPDLPMLADIPADAAIRYTPTTEPLAEVIAALEKMPPSEVQELGAKGLAWTSSSDWATVARATIDAYELALGVTAP
jgi:glycosyltransferase involved in cell wall biosynthesis